MSRFAIDSHKLVYHVDRLVDWLNKKTVYPIYMELSPTGACNHRCTYCGLDFLQYRPQYLDTNLLRERFSELGRLGLKSVMFAGEGEPFLHSDIVTLIRQAKESGMDVAITTNGVLLKQDIADKILAHIEWIKLSVDAATPDTYAKIHRCPEKDFDCLIKNIVSMVNLKKQNNYRCTLGVQLLLLPENHNEVIPLTKLVKDIGVDYIVIKPYSQHPQSKTRLYECIKYSEYEYLTNELAKYNSQDFSVIFRAHTMRKWDEKKRNYKRCLAFPFWTYIDASGNVWGCSVYLGDKRFFYGNIYKQSFQEIWGGQRRLDSLRWAEKELDIEQCRVNCRMDEANRYLWELTHCPAHVNFI